jgi:hypothetical protein
MLEARHPRAKVARADETFGSQKNNYYKQKENMGSFSLPWANTIEEAPHTRVFVSETVTSNQQKIVIYIYRKNTSL